MQGKQLSVKSPDKSTYSNGVYTLTKQSQWTGYDIPKDMLTVNKTYVLSFKIQKSDAKTALKNIGGACSSVEPISFKVDGKTLSASSYGNNNPGNNISDDTKVHTVEFKFKFKNKTGYLCIQPNRGLTTKIVAKISNVIIYEEATTAAKATTTTTKATTTTAQSTTKATTTTAQSTTKATTTTTATKSTTTQTVANLMQGKQLSVKSPDKSTYSNGVYTLTKQSQWTGYDIPKDMLTVNKTYVLSFKIQKSDAKTALKNIGGACSSVEPISFKVDGKTLSASSYGNNNPGNNISDDTKVHTVEFKFKFKNKTGYLCIQPNRGLTTKIVAKISDVVINAV